MRSILKFPKIYNFFSKIVGGNAPNLFLEKYIRPRNGDKILDLGCGPADILSRLPSVEYVGLDLNPAYIAHAKQRFKNRGIFLNAKIDRKMIDHYALSGFDIALAIGVLHHLNDDEAIQLFELARSVLKPDGRLITWDGCYVKGQSWLAHLILSQDRGQYVRTQEAYHSLASILFENVKVSIHHDLFRIPYTIIIMECSI
jgi:SAM-dependent methyltransferase